MKFRKIFQFEFTYQLRQLSTWLYFGITLVLAFLFIMGNYVHDAREGYFMVNAPIVIATATVLCCVFWLLIGASVAGDAAGRDVQTRMFSLSYTTHASKAAYLGGRFLAALALNSLILLGIPAGLFIAMHFSGIEAEILGPYRSAAYLTSFFYIVIPNAFFATAVQFSLAAITRRAMAGYLGGAILFVAAYILGQGLQDSGEWGNLIDPMSFTPVMSYMSEWSPMDRNMRLVLPEGSFLANRLLWLGISIGMLVFAYVRFRFTNPSAKNAGKKNSLHPGVGTDTGWLKWEKTESLPVMQGTFNLKTRMHQLKLITFTSFRAIAKKPTGLLLLGGIAFIVALALPGNLKGKGVPLLPGTDQVLNILAAPFTEPGKFWIIIFLLTIFYAGELVWRERETGLAELANPIPVPEWILFLSRFLSLSLLLLTGLVFMLISGILAQFALGAASIDIALYLKILFGFQLVECLLFAILALVVHVLINQKYAGHLAMLIIFGGIIYSSSIGLEHKLFVFGSSPRWTYTNMGGFSQSVEPWLWFKAYWLAWALLLAVVAKLLWVRGREESLKARLQLARRRFTRTTALTTVVAVVLILITGRYIYYNTNILNKYETASELLGVRAAYEHQYGKYNNIPQPHLTHVNLEVELYPERREFEVKGTYHLVNNRSVSIDSVHLSIPLEVDIKSLTFSRLATPVHADRKSGYFIYAFRSSLEHGDTLLIDFNLHHKAEGFTNTGNNPKLTENFTYIRNYEWLPVIGYQQYRELDEMGLRKKYGLSPRPENASLYDLKARNSAPFAEHIYSNAVVGTIENHIVVAPGSLRKTWKKGNRRYFHYSTDAPIRNEYAFFSANYALHEEQWTPSKDSGKTIAVEIYYDPGNTENLDRMMQSAKASLGYFINQFGPYPYPQLRFVANPGYSGGLHAAPINISAGEGFFVLNPMQDPRGFDLVTAVVAHEVAHQWWGNQFKSAYVEGAGVLSESLAWYSAMGVLEENYGHEHLKKLLSFLREEYENPRTRAGVPLLQATDWYNYYRKGPFALYAMSEYIGRSKVDSALSRLFQKHPAGKIPMPTTLDLYQELQAVTPDSLQYLLHDLFEENTFWDLEAKQATIKQTENGSWQVSLNVQVSKQVVSEIGMEKEVLLKDWIEIGIFAPAEKGAEQGKRLYLGKHLINSKHQTITVTVPVKPSQAGIDPNHLLIDWNIKNNFIEVKN